MFRSLFRRAKQSPLRQSDTPRRRARLGLERLESREVPATFTVTSPADVPQAGRIPVLTLREAIDLANMEAVGVEHTINFDAAILTGATITILSQLPMLQNNIIINGLGPNVLTVCRDATRGSFRLMQVAGGSASTIRGLTLTNGYVADPRDRGGAIEVQGGNLTLENMTFTHNRAGPPNQVGDGGAVAALGGSTLTITTSTFSSNSAGSGGAVWVGDWTAFSISNCCFNSNTATFRGGALWLGEHGEVTLNAVEILENTAANGGGIYTRRKLILTGGTDITLNSASTWGGGVYVDVEGSIVYDGVSFGSNAALSGDGVYRANEATRTDGPGGVTWNGNSETVGL